MNNWSNLQHAIAMALAAASLVFTFWTGYSLGRALELNRQLTRTMERSR